MKGPFRLSFARPAQVLGTLLALASGTVHAAPSPDDRGGHGGRRSDVG